MNFPRDLDTVLFVIADSLRFDVRSARLPTVNRLATDGIDCHSFYTPGASTPSSMPGFVQSRSPLDHRGYGLELPPNAPTIAEHLADHGVMCAGWHSNVYTSKQYGFDRGFDRYTDLGTSDGSETGRPSGRSIARRVTDALGAREVAERVYEQLKRRGFADPNPKVRAEVAFDRALEWLPEAADGAKRFGYLHLMDTHLPYLPPEVYRERVPGAPTSPTRVYDLWQTLIEDPSSLSDEDVAALRALYHGEALYVDDQLKALVTELQERGLWESTALVFTADHGELFRDHEVPDNDNVKHPDYLCGPLTHTPLVIAGGQIPDWDVSKLTSGLDVAPTISELFDIDPASEWNGQVLDEVDRDYVISALAHAYGGGTGARVEREATHVAVRDEDVAVLWWLNERNETEYYRREGENERRVEPDGDERFERALQRAIEHGETYTAVSDHGQTGNDVSKRLRDLGYVE